MRKNLSRILNNTMSVIFVAIICASCNDNSTEQKSDSADVSITKTSPKSGTTQDDTQKYVESLREHKARLKNLSPVDQQLLADWLPEQIGDMERVKLKVGDKSWKEASVARAYTIRTRRRERT